MICSLQDETNYEYKHLVNSRSEIFRKQDTKILSCFLNNSNPSFDKHFSFLSKHDKTSVFLHTVLDLKFVQI